ncbi:glycosyltransferase family 2 protein [filamentous cyanobacterium LEGE 11480]|uniref:Glycosyltransferase family 2 protein n=1 Tax=Romeriopsis navalis LEGE 11480 TaxID=2777977 RepID=A0A928VHW0_9CYAN|nr:hypothetical protein [Romeriopsis navalis]MBE9028903.1 glycosyltransferase family 2 protein [Romeriopsis navalis LEGE 11480]
MTYAPIALFVYKRPDHARRSIESLMQCPEFAQSPLYVFCDGAKHPEDQPLVEQTRMVVRTLLGAHGSIIESEQNCGLAESIISCVTKLVNEFERVIVLEDDLILSPYFLDYMNSALDFYADQPSVMQVSGYVPPVREFANSDQAMVFPLINSWGWATWRRAWKYFDIDASGWESMKTDRALRKQFNLDGHYDLFSMLKLQMTGEIDSWAIRWNWSVFRQNGYVLYPPVSYVDNIGKDGSGTHSSKLASLIFGSTAQRSASGPTHLPAHVTINPKHYKAFKKSLFLPALRNTLGVIKRNVKTFLRRFR